MTRYTRREIVEILEIDEGFVAQLEREAIIERDADAPETPHGTAERTYSERMLERARVAHSLVHDLDVNLAGAAVIVRMREELGTLRGTLRVLAARVARSEREGRDD